MKKILFLIILSIIGVMVVYGADYRDYFYYDTKVPNMYITKVKGDQLKNGAPFLLHKSDGTIVYCIEPFDYVTDTAYDGYIGFNSLFGVSMNQINRMNLVARYGYGYGNHTDLKWYGVTQYLVWQALGLDDIYFTDSYYGNRITAYTPEINEINQMVNTYNTLPSFSGNTYNFSVKTSYSIEDTKGVLKYFDISTNSEDINVTVINNTLNIKTYKEGRYTVTFTKKDNSHNYELYYNSNGQNLIFPGKIDDLKTTITINVHKGKIEINKHDLEMDKPYKNTTFKDSVYGLYKAGVDSLVDTLSLDNDGKGKFDDLQLTDYYVKEIVPPIGYELDDTKYYVSLSLKNKDKIVDVYDEVIKKEILITKYYGNKISNNYNFEADVLFELYDNDELINSVRTNKDGNINLSLPYGKYTLRQVTTKDGYTKNDDIKIVVSDSKPIIYDLYDYEIVRYGSVNLTKKGRDGTLLDGVLYEVYASEDIMSKDGYIYYKKNELIDRLLTINGQAFTNLYYGKYYLKEIKTVDGYVLNSDKYYFDVFDKEISLSLFNDKIIEIPKINNNYVSVPDTFKNDIDYLETFGVLLVLLGYCVGLYAYKKIVGIY